MEAIQYFTIDESYWIPEQHNSSKKFLKRSMNPGYKVEKPFYLDSQEVKICLTVFNSEEFNKTWLKRSDHLTYEQCHSSPWSLSDSLLQKSKGQVSLSFKEFQEE